MNEKYFTTGEFAKLCGVKKDTLFHYDDIGLFSPAAVKENGYRYYSYRQFDTFSLISALREIGMSLKEIKKYLDRRSPQNLLSLLEEQSSAVDKKMEKLSAIKKLIDRTYKDTLFTIQINADSITVQHFKPSYGILSNDSSLAQATHSDFMESYVHFCQQNQLSITDNVGIILSSENIQNGQYNHISYLFMQSGSKKKPGQCLIRKAGNYLVAYHKGSYDTTFQTYKKILRYCETHGIPLGDYFYEEYLLYEMAVKDEKDYLTRISMKVKDKP